MLATALVAGALAVFTMELTRLPAGPPPKYADGLRIGHAVDKRSRCDDANVPLVRIEISSYNPTSETIRFGVEVCLSRAVLLLIARGRATPTVAPVTTLRGPALESARHPLLTIRLQGYPSPESEHPFGKLDLTNVAHVAGRFVTVGAIGLNVEGAAARYPFDSYGATETVSLLDGEHATAQELSLRPNIEVFRGPRLTPLALSAQTGPVADPRASGVSIQLHRPALAKVYVLLVAIVPLILAVLLSVLMLSQHKKRNSRVGIETLAGVSAVLLAILPIRLVLVPASISSLTIIDYWLGFVVASLVGIAAVAVWMALSPTKREVGM